MSWAIPLLKAPLFILSIVKAARKIISPLPRKQPTKLLMESTFLLLYIIFTLS